MLSAFDACFNQRNRDGLAQIAVQTTAAILD